jgi:hypothetical protein
MSFPIITDKLRDDIREGGVHWGRYNNKITRDSGFTDLNPLIEFNRSPENYRYVKVDDKNHYKIYYNDILLGISDKDATAFHGEIGRKGTVTIHSVVVRNEEYNHDNELLMFYGNS